MQSRIGIGPGGDITVKFGARIDASGEPIILLDENMVTIARVTFQDWLNDSATISTATIVTEQCTASSVVLSPNVTLTISAATSYDRGGVTLKATASDGSVWQGVINVRRPARKGVRPEGDYA